MAKNRFTFTTAEGNVDSRTSERIYTHVIVGRVDLVRARAEIDASTRAGEGWDFEERMSKVKAGERMWPDQPFLMKQEDADKYAAFMAAHPDRAAYVAQRRAAALADLEKRYGAGDKSPEMVLQWSMSQANALKAVGSKMSYWVDVAVKPVDVEPAPLPKKKKKQ